MPGGPATPPTGVVASLTVSPCSEAIEFYVAAFDAVEAGSRMDMPNGMVAHAEIEIAGTRIMLGDEWPDGPTRTPANLGGTSASLSIYVEDVDAAWEKALAAGAEVVFPLQDQFYGDRSGRVRDPYGHSWGIGQQVEELTEEEMEARMAEWMGANT